MKFLVKAALLAGVSCISATAMAQDKNVDAKLKWDVAAPPGLTVRQIEINTDEGSWMNLDVSPDGKTIAFDLLGDIYTVRRRLAL